MPGTLGLTSLQGAYEAGGGTITYTTALGPLTMQGSALVAGAAGTSGPDYMRIMRGAVNVLNTAYNATDLITLIYSSAVNGIDLGPDPTIIPDRAIISLGVPDRLTFLRQDRLITTGSPGFFRWVSELSMDAAIPLQQRSFGGFIDLGGTFQFNASASFFGMGNALLHRATWKNANGVVANLGPSFLFANNAIYQADGATITSSQARIFFDNAAYNVINAGVGTQGAAVGHVSLYGNLNVGASWTLQLRRLCFMLDATVTGSLVTQVMLDVDDLTTATNNYVIRSSLTAGAGKLFINHTGSAGSLFGGPVEIDGDLNHDGVNAGFMGAAPVPRPAAYSITNSTPSRTLNVSTVTLTVLANVVAQILQDMGDVGGNGLLDTNI